MDMKITKRQNNNMFLIDELSPISCIYFKYKNVEDNIEMKYLKKKKVEIM
jgi:hypothetical protein